MKAALLLIAALSQAAELRFEVRHERALKDHYGVLSFDDQGVTYDQTVKSKKHKPEHARWTYQDIQQLWVSPGKIVIATYTDRKWLLGLDKEYEFFALPGKQFEGVYPLLKDKLDQRFVAAVADEAIKPLWEIPTKLLGVVQGSEGVLSAGPEHIVYKTAKPGFSRTWRYQDIENISTSGPFELTLTTYERAKAQYGSMKAFHFQLKQRLDDKRFQILWKRLNHDKGLQFLSNIQERKSESQ